VDDQEVEHEQPDQQDRPVVDQRVFPLEQATDALDRLATGTAKGRVVLTE
jgi:NADPH:quinone reductase-like Zn-dependent oxidoreductase